MNLLTIVVVEERFMVRIFSARDDGRTRFEPWSFLRPPAAETIITFILLTHHRPPPSLSECIISNIMRTIIYLGESSSTFLYF